MPFVRHLDNVRPVIESVSIKKIEDRNPEWNPDLEPGPFIFCSLPCNYTTTKTQSKTFNVNSTWASTSFSLSSRPHVSGCFFFFGKRSLAYGPQVSGEKVKGHQKRIFSKTLSRVEIENAGFSLTRGRTKTEIFEYDDVTHNRELRELRELRMLREGCYRISIVLAFSCGRTKTIRIN